jgi:hypothetical protein
MNIRMKVVSLLALLFVILIAIEIAVQREVLMPSFADLERDDAKVSMRRIDYAVDMALDGLELTAADWGNWLAWISTSAYYPKSKAGFARHAVKTSCISFHQGTVTGLFSNPEASTIGR